MSLTSVTPALGRGDDKRPTRRLSQFICLAGEEEGRDKRLEDVHGWWPRSRSSGVGDGGGGGGGRSTSLFKGGTPNLEAPLDEDQAS